MSTKAVAATTLGAPFRNQNFCCDFLWVHTHAPGQRIHLGSNWVRRRKFQTARAFSLLIACLPKFKFLFPRGAGRRVSEYYFFPRANEKESDSNASDMRGSITRPRILKAISPVTHTLSRRAPTPARSRTNFLPHFVALVSMYSWEILSSRHAHTDSRLDARTS